MTDEINRKHREIVHFHNIYIYIYLLHHAKVDLLGWIWLPFGFLLGFGCLGWLGPFALIFAGVTGGRFSVITRGVDDLDHLIIVIAIITSIIIGGLSLFSSLHEKRHAIYEWNAAKMIPIIKLLISKNCSPACYHGVNLIDNIKTVHTLLLHLRLDTVLLDINDIHFQRLEHWIKKWTTCICLYVKILGDNFHKILSDC